MKLLEFFNKSTTSAKQLIELYDVLDFQDKRTRSEWRDKLFADGIVNWGKRVGVWRSVSVDKKIILLGSGDRKKFQENLIAWRPALLQHALVMMLSAIDKILHQATTTKNFVRLLKSGNLDDFMKNFPISETYGIAMESRVRRGHGGKKKTRPANKIREVVAAKLYELSFLGTRNLEHICAANGTGKIFSKYAKHLGRKGVEPLRSQWSSIYKRRNTIVHECNISRTKISPKKIRFDVAEPSELKRDITFAEDFGKFLASKLG